MSEKKRTVAIIDYGMGNLFSIKHACLHVGLDAEVTSDKKELESADIAILPGVGAFGDCMEIIRSLDLVSPIKDFADSGRPLLGICLGMQLLMSESYEFGTHKGLGLFEGTVEHFGKPVENGEVLKVPHVGWNRIFASREAASAVTPREECPLSWNETTLSTVREGAFMYFVHSYYVNPADANLALTWTRYGDRVFCSGLKKDNIRAFQFHPERSGLPGLDIYRQLAALNS